MALNVPYEQSIQPVMLSDVMGKWSQIRHQQQMADLARQQEARLGQQAEREAKQGELSYQTQAHKALKDVMTDFRSSLERRAKELNLQPNSPEYQQLANAMYSSNYDKIVHNISGKTLAPNANIDLDAVSALAGMTPQEELQQKIEGQKAEWGAHLPYQMLVAMTQAGMHQAAQEKEFGYRKELAGIEQGYRESQNKQEHDWRITELDNQNKARKEQIQLQHDLKGNAPIKIPAKITDAYIQNRAAIHKIDNALNMVGNNPNALGLGNMVGDTITQRTDPEGVSTRAIIADIGSLKIHDRSGAAVTASEAPRLKPFIPNVTDTPETVIKKLEQFKAEYEAINNDINAMYSEGLKPINSQGGTSRQPQQPITANSIPMPANADDNSWNEFLRLKGLR